MLQLLEFLKTDILAKLEAQHDWPTIYPLAIFMKLRKMTPQSLTQQSTSRLIKPEPPTETDIERAQFKDKTYYPPVRSRNNANNGKK